jgi:hypothetical protein
MALHLPALIDQNTRIRGRSKSARSATVVIHADRHWHTISLGACPSWFGQSRTTLTPGDESSGCGVRQLSPEEGKGGTEEEEGWPEFVLSMAWPS